MFYDCCGEQVWPNNMTDGGAPGYIPWDRWQEQPFQYKGQFGYFTDIHTGLCYCLNRYYDPRSGRWTSRDPIGLDGGVNVYQYCGGNPVMYADPSGLQNPAALATAREGQVIYINFFRKAPATSRLGALGTLGLCFASVTGGWAIGTAIDQHWGISDWGGAYFGGMYDLEIANADDPSYIGLKRMWENSSAGHQALLEQQYAFLARYGHARRSHGYVENHHLLPKQYL
jgi:RHS repeat-associated protein